MSSDTVIIDRATLQGFIAGMDRRFLSLEDGATYSGLSVKSLRRLAAAGKLQRYRPVRGKILIDRLELDALVLSSNTSLRVGRGIRQRA